MKLVLRYLFIISIWTLGGTALYADDCGQNCASPATDSCNIGCSTCVMPCQSQCKTPKTLFVPRSQSFYQPREIIGTQLFNHTYGKQETYGCFWLTPVYTRSFRPDDIVDYLFGQAAHNGTITVSGSSVTNRESHEVLADYFGLPTDFKSTVCFNPRVSNFLIDVGWYIGFNNLKDGFYGIISTPFCLTQWDLHPQEHSIDTGNNNYDRGYMTIDEIANKQLEHHFLDTVTGNYVWGDMQSPLSFGKITCRSLTKTRLADIRITAGYDIFKNNDAHVSIDLRTAFPTGNKPNGQYLFEPIAGNSGHFEVGAGLTSHWILWENNREHLFGVWINLVATHLCTSRQVRSFDLADNGPGSRYMLLAQHEPIPLDPETREAAPYHLNNVPLQEEYAHSLFPAINVTTLCCDVSASIQVDFLFKCMYKRENIEIDFGYNFWSRSKESICVTGTYCPDNFSIKGDAYLYGAIENNYTEKTAVPLAISQQNSATLYTGGNHNSTLNKKTSPTMYTIAPDLNPIIDNSELATAANLKMIEENVMTPVIGSEGQINASVQPIFVDLGSDICIDSASSPQQMSHSLFVNASYAWEEGIDDPDYKDSIPFIGSGFATEFATSSESSKNCSCTGALSQWSLWIKGGFAY